MLTLSLLSREVTPDTADCFLNPLGSTSVHRTKVVQDQESCQVVAISTEETVVDSASDTWPSSPHKLHPRTCIWYLERAWEKFFLPSYPFSSLVSTTKYVAPNVLTLIMNLMCSPLHFSIAP